MTFCILIMVAHGIVVAVVLWLWRKFGGCGGYFFGLLWIFFWWLLFIYKVVLVDVSLCRWRLSVLLQQWLLVAVVVTVVVVGLFYLGWVMRFVNMVGFCGFFFSFYF